MTDLEFIGMVLFLLTVTGFGFFVLWENSRAKRRHRYYRR